MANKNTVCIEIYTERNALTETIAVSQSRSHSYDPHILSF